MSPADFSWSLVSKLMFGCGAWPLEINFGIPTPPLLCKIDDFYNPGLVN